MSAGVLNTWKHFAIPAFTPVLLNLSFIAFTLLLTPHLDEPIFALAAAVIVGGVLQLGIQIPSLMKLGVLPRPVNPFKAAKDASVIRVMKLMIPALFGVGVAQLSLLINTNIASRLGTGSVTWLSFADRLMEFPTALLGVALGSVLLPSLSAAFAKNDLTRYNALLDNGLRLVVLLAIPAAVGLGLMAEALVAFLYQGKNFLVFDVHQTSLAVMGYSFGLLGLIAIKILAPACAALQRRVCSHFRSCGTGAFCRCGQLHQRVDSFSYPDSPRTIPTYFRVADVVRENCCGNRGNGCHYCVFATGSGLGRYAK